MNRRTVEEIENALECIESLCYALHTTAGRLRVLTLVWDVAGADSNSPTVEVYRAACLMAAFADDACTQAHKDARKMRKALAAVQGVLENAKD